MNTIYLWFLLISSQLCSSFYFDCYDKSKVYLNITDNLLCQNIHKFKSCYWIIDEILVQMLCKCFVDNDSNNTIYLKRIIY